VATHAGNVAPGYVEIETGIERDRLSRATTTSLFSTTVKFGVAPRTQFSVGIPVLQLPGERHGIGDVSAALKIRVLENHPLLADFALQPQLKLNSGGSRGSGTTDAGLLLISSRSIGALDLDLNAGVTRRSGDGMGAPKTATLWAVAGAFPVVGKLSFTSEIYGYPGTSGPAGVRPVVAVLAGPTYLVHPSFNLDIGIIEPISGPQSRAFYFGLVANVGRLPLPKH
jgi:hypothetical protein